jgi:hypothetical protein
VRQLAAAFLPAAGACPGRPLPKGQGCASDFGPLCPAADTGKDQKCRDSTCFGQHLKAKLGSLITD